MKIAIIGLGAFGSHLARVLAEMNHEVLAIDSSEAAVEGVKDFVALAAVADATDEALIEELGLGSLDAIVVAIGKQFENSVMVSTRMSQVEGPTLHVRVVSELHEKLLEMAGISHTVKVEWLAASQFARKLDNAGVIRHFIVDDTHAIGEVRVPREWIGRKLLDASLRTEHRLNLITIRRKAEGDAEAEAMEGVMTPDTVFESGDLLVLYGSDRDLRRFCDRVEAEEDDEGGGDSGS